MLDAPPLPGAPPLPPPPLPVELELATQPKHPLAMHTPLHSPTEQGVLSGLGTTRQSAFALLQTPTSHADDSAVQSTGLDPVHTPP